MRLTFFFLLCCSLYIHKEIVHLNKNSTAFAWTTLTSGLLPDEGSNALLGLLHFFNVLIEDLYFVLQIGPFLTEIEL